MNAARERRGGPCWAPIRDGIMLLSAETVNDCSPITINDREEYITGVILTQYSVKAGLEKFGEQGQQAVTKELSQIHNMNRMVPLDATTLTTRQKRHAVSSLMFLKEKRDKSVKGRACADGRKQREDEDRPTSSSPTVANKSVMLTAVIDAHE